MRSIIRQRHIMCKCIKDPHIIYDIMDSSRIIIIVIIFVLGAVVAFLLYRKITSTLDSREHLIHTKINDLGTVVMDHRKALLSLTNKRRAARQDENNSPQSERTKQSNGRVRPEESVRVTKHTSEAHVQDEDTSTDDDVDELIENGLSFFKNLMTEPYANRHTPVKPTVYIDDESEHDSQNEQDVNEIASVSQNTGRHDVGYKKN